MKKLDGKALARGTAALGILCLLICLPEASARGVAAGLKSCTLQVIPALFPFFVVTGLILGSPLAGWLGLGLLPVTRLGLGIRQRRAATVLLLCWLGGFAVAASAISCAYRQGELDRRQAMLLTVCGVGSGPAFVVNTVGLLMLGSAPVGICLLGAMLAANVCTALAFRLLLSLRLPSADAAPGPHSAVPPRPDAGLVEAVQNATRSMLTVCGFVVFFRFLCEAAAQALSLPGATAYLLCAGLEVTSGCAAGAALPGRAALACCAALSVQSLSVFLQVRALLCAELPLWPLAVTRPIHLGFSLLFLRLLLGWLPGTVQALSTLAPRVICRTRTAPDAALVLFALCCLMLFRLEGSKSRFCRNRKGSTE
ncbi:hypothetical protein [Allofournierella sp. CML151]|uniref:hypothetical protein n=1 Tax=Allofournierella sp. CML151 TaxID=2998082 RepID=UPI0022EA7004|nr:hypothetical protein [Fournierella sp. CML151]